MCVLLLPWSLQCFLSFLHSLLLLHPFCSHGGGKNMVHGKGVIPLLPTYILQGRDYFKKLYSLVVRNELEKANEQRSEAQTVVKYLFPPRLSSPSLASHPSLTGVLHCRMSGSYFSWMSERKWCDTDPSPFMRHVSKFVLHFQVIRSNHSSASFPLCSARKSRPWRPRWWNWCRSETPSFGGSKKKFRLKNRKTSRIEPQR